MNNDDILWKAILEDIFDDFLRFFYVDADNFIDFSRGFEYLDKELEQLFPPEHNKFAPRFVDKLVKVFTKQGKEEWILVHIEVQGYKDSQFAKRMFLYYCRIFDKYDKRITAFAIFTDSDGRFHPKMYVEDFMGTKLTYTFNTYKILDQVDAELEADNNPFAVVVLVVKLALKGKQLDQEELLNLKVDFARRLLEKNIDKSKIRVLMNFLYYYIRFENKQLERKFEKEVELLTQNKATMGIEEFLLERARNEGITIGEKRGEKIGEKRGEIKGIKLGEKKVYPTVQNLLKRGMSIEEVSEVTTLSIEEVTSIADKLKKGRI